MLSLAMAAVVVAIGSRRVVASLERSSMRLRRANQRDRRHARQLAAVESVGRLLAKEGPTPAALDSMMGVLEGTFGYRYPSVYVWDGFALQLGAQRNYRFPIQTVAPDKGILGRIARTQEPAFLPDARSDPEFLSGDPDVVSEIGVPLLDDGELLGILNVETRAITASMMMTSRRWRSSATDSPPRSRSDANGRSSPSARRSSTG
jgi:putative methionine-R-sulfoxide reductase with GAF domain